MDLNNVMTILSFFVSILGMLLYPFSSSFSFFFFLRRKKAKKTDAKFELRTKENFEGRRRAS